VSDLSEVPEADRLEQRDPVDAVADDLPEAPTAEAAVDADLADLADQAMPVDATQESVGGTLPDEVNEADWLEQRLVERDPDEDVDRY